jgi:hypothetical protein
MELRLPTSYLSTETDLDNGGGASDSKIPSQLAVKTYVDTAVAGAANLTTKTNDNAGSITVGQVVYIKSNGNVDLAQATISTLDENELLIVKDASIATTASGSFYAAGSIVPGFTGLTPGKTVYVSRATAGAVTQDLSAFVAGEQVYAIGRAISATEVTFDPDFIMEY